MKIVKSFFILAICLFFVSCSQSESNVSISKQDFQINNEYIKAEAFIPQINGIEDQKLLDYLNNQVQKFYKDKIRESEIYSQADFQRSQKEKHEFKPVELKGKFEINYNENDILSIKETIEKTDYYFENGSLKSSKSESFSYINLHIKTAREIRLTDVFDGKDQRQELSNLIKKSYKKYVNPYSIHDFYITKDSIVICIPAYELYSGESQNQEFIIPIQEIKDKMPKDFNIKPLGAYIYSTFKEQENDLVYKENVIYPSIEFMESDNNKIVNEKIQKSILGSQKELKKESFEQAQDSQKFGFDPAIYFYTTNYEVRKNDENFLSLTLLKSMYTGGAHGMAVMESLNWDLKNQEELKLKDLFKSDYDYASKINEEIKNQIQKINEFDKSQSKIESREYYPRFQGFTGISSDQNFYLTSNSIIIYFGQYEIGSYAEGMPEFEIPMKKLEKGLK